MSMIIYLTGLASLCTGIFLIRKSDEKQNAVVYLVFTAVLFMIVQSVEAGIINLIPFISINAIIFGCLHIFEGSVLWYFIIFKKKRQSYFFKITDVMALVILAVFVVIVAVRQFGIALDDFNFGFSDPERHYMFSDPARHYMFARDVADNGHLTSLYFSALNSGLIMNALHGIIHSFSFYKIFILFEIGILFLNGAMFWISVRRHLENKFSAIIGIILAVVYMLGYPWNSMVFGAAYLSTSILCITMIVFLLDVYFYNVFYSNKMVIALLFASCYALLCSYSLFVPPALGCIFLLFIYKYIRRKSIPVKRLFIIGGVLLTVCLFIGIAFLYFWLVRGVLDKQLDALSWWGYTYGTPYADFLFAIPFCILWIIKSVKSKTVNMECIILFVFLSYIFVFFLGNYFGKVSAYYYYKNYYILWLAVFLIVLRAMISLKDEQTFMFSYLIAWGALFLVYISSAGKRLPQDYNLDLAASSDGQTASNYFGLYNFNIVYGHNGTLSKSVKDLYMKAAKLSEETGEFIPYIGEYAESEWTYFALAATVHRNVLAGKNYEAAVEELQKYPYILSVECEEPMVNVSKFLNTLPIEYENESGKIYKMDITQTTEEALKSDTDIDIILRYGLPKLERMGWVEQDEYVNSLQVIKKISKLGLDKEDFLYPELGSAKIENSVSNLKDNYYSGRTSITFTGSTSEELQQVINDNPGTAINICSKRITLNGTIVLQNNTIINGNGVILEGYGLEYAFKGKNISDICLNDIHIEGKINYGIYLTDCNNITISECKINRMLQKAICIIGNTKGLNVSNNEMQFNNAGSLYLAGNVTEGLIASNNITDNGGMSEWMSAIVLTDVMPCNRYDIEEASGREYDIQQRDGIDDQKNCPHDIIMRNNNISNNNTLGIFSSGAYKCYVIDNRICQNGYGGLRLDYGTIGFCLEGNFFNGNGDAYSPGIVLDNSAYNILRSNIITNNYVGIKLMRASVRNLIMENVVYGGENNVYHLYAIEIGTGSEGDINENFDISPSYENIVCRNNISGNHYSGIFIDKGCYVNDVFDNIILGSQTFSVEAISDMFNSIINNTSNADVMNTYYGN